MPQSLEDLPPQAQQLIAQLQKQQQQLQQLGEQRQQIKAQERQIEKALDSLEETEEEEDVFKVVGPVVVKSTRDELIDELEERKETMEVKLGSVKKKEKKIQEGAKKGQEKLQKLMSGGEEPEKAG